ncbi:MAG: 4'-phosphopantetheinyl transferase family protein [Terriglobia bacterium]
MPCFLMDVNEDPWNLDGRSIRLRPSDVHVWLSSLNVAAPWMSLMERMLSSDELARASRYRREETRLEFMLGRGLLRLLLGAYLGRDPRELRFAAGLHGKPELAGDLKGSPLQFNVSHSYGTALHAFSLGRRVGIDVERIRQDFSGLDLARRFFSPRESAFLSSQPELLQPRTFFSIWARKEALLKARGEGLAGNLDRIEMPLPPQGSEMILSFPEDAGENACWSVVDLNAGPDVAAALVAEGVDCQVTLRRWVVEAPLAAAGVECKAGAAMTFKAESPGRA